MTGVMLPPIHRSGYARTLATFRAGLDLAALDAARAWGDDMVPPEQFIRLTARR